MNRIQGSKPRLKPTNPKAKLPSNPKPTTTQPPSSSSSSSNLLILQQSQDPQSLPATKTTPSPSSNPSDPTTPSSLLPILTPALEILSRFHHRNKNQHRLSKWWAEADMLRRHLRKLIEAANEWCDKEPEREGKRRKEEARRKKKEKYERLGRVEKKQDGVGQKGGEEEVKGEDREEEEEEEDREAREVRLRAEYLRGKLGPRAYFAFSQLSADRQFAHLGLMLLGVLAQVDKALSAFASVPIDENDDAAADEAAEDRGPNLNATVMGQLADEVPNQRHNDIGVAVSREELLAMMSESTTASGPTDGSLARSDARDHPLPTTETDSGAAPPPVTGENRQGKNKSEKKKRPRDDEDDKNDDEDKDDFSSGPTPPVSEQKKKKKRKAGDDGTDIDDIFASFDKPSQRKKKDKAEKSVVASKTTTVTTSIATATTTTTKVKTTTDSSVPTTTTTTTTTPAEAETQHGKDDLDDIFASLEKPKKKKTKVKKTDDLDDIFASFDKPKTKKKKKKAGAGAGADEFDDIFGGL
ncbi:hypothetical protein GE21DRAFT_4181 [Neurospora crassa]|uniref:RNase MRP protein 1 RNA binding domain-containing protein n=1 Tax=Neurospora crassa (strain ATCC 24698 / 74-OR23-1A / CBS 708.71 / DSM 1257 / FGSC 987) TaxID=367110 RepID=Q7SBB9_NEUCR|nr:hypothetical protein NCU06204 [Neurospora crassa OR74A]EAA33684.1 hypothetical protein NCU06204 [Neurospora crassa OR74A]KHE87036.1 hypothetical protein GE21DRAFT_4181 [Neurospora crassa]|eukprot:XP_962920.1 hypothetical protein NCU06204 [Neurospora crassa OR74A]